MALSDDVYAFYDCESDLSDSHTGGKDFMENNSPTYSVGKVSNAVDLVRASNMFGSRTEAFPTGSQDLYIGGWKYVASGTTGNMTLFNKPGSYWLQTYYSSGSYIRPTFYCYSGGAKILTWGSNITLDSWFFFWAGHDDGTQANLSIDNATRVTNTSATSGIDTGTTALAIGAYSSGTHHLNGSIDSLGIFTGDPNTTRQSDLYNSGSGVAYSDFAGGGGYAGTPSRSWIMLDGVQVKCSEQEIERVRRRLEARGMSKRHMRPEHFGLRWDVRRGCLWAPAREIAVPSTAEVPGAPRLILPKHYRRSA